MFARVLRFGPGRILLEDLLVRHAMAPKRTLPEADFVREPLAAGVMMIPVPSSGIFERVDTVEAAQGWIPGLDEIEITARRHHFIAAWPEGSELSRVYFCSRADPRGRRSGFARGTRCVEI